MPPELQNSQGLESALLAIAAAIQQGDDLSNIRFDVSRNAAWTPTSGTENTIPFDNVLYDPAKMFNTSNFRVTAPVSGLYQFNAIMSAVASGATAFVAIYKNGQFYKRGQRDGSNNNSYYGLSVSIPLVAGDYVQLLFYVSAGSIETGGGQNWFNGYIIRKL